MPRFKHQKKRKDSWSSAEVSRLRRLVEDNAGIAEIIPQFPGRTRQGIQAKIARFGIKRGSGPSWKKHHRAIQIKYGFDPDDHFPFREIHEYLLKEGLI